MNKTVLFILFVLSLIPNLWSQSESLTSSPYSLYGLGIHNNTLIGKWNGLSGAGLGYASSNEINPLNPASYAVLHKNGFWFDVGAKGGFNSYQNQRSSDRAIDFNFSDLAIGFSVANKLGMGLTLLPYSSVGYTLSGIESNMEGSQETYYTNVNGYGGLNDLKWSVGYEIIKPLRIGLSTSFLFGNVHETEYLQVSSSYFYMEKNRFYKGIKLGLGIQFQPSDNFSIGSVIQFPTELNGSMTRDISKQVDGVEIVLEDAVAMETSNFELPLEMGVGVSYALLDKKLTFNADYYKKFWSSTLQKDKLGTYQDQNIYNIGAEFLYKIHSDKYYQKIKYRLGYSYDSGYLSINDSNIANQNFTLGLGLPLNNQNFSNLNIAYTYGQRGHIQNQMVKEKYHLITLNLSLENKWFVKHKIE
jgi:hypothetical protein